MIFAPYYDEALVINEIQKVRNEDYVLLRLTPTMIDKNNIDANEYFRDMLLSHNIVNYEVLKNGGSNGIEYTSKLILPDKIDSVKLKFYRVNNSRGDRRFSIETIKRKSQNGIFNAGDLLYISIYNDFHNTPNIYIINLTHNIPSRDIIESTVGVDPITEKFNEIKPRLKEILLGGFYDNSKGSGVLAPKDVGDTLESLLKVTTNNSPGADLDGLIELKAKSSKTLDTLFTLRPCFDGTEVANFEPNDRSRVSAFARLYGYDSDKHPGYSSLYITIGSEDYPQNGKGFFLEVDESNSKVRLMRKNPITNQKEETAFWHFNDLRKQLYEKHPSTLWFKAEKKTVDNLVQFKYTEIEFSRTPQFMTFLSLIKNGIITYDWRGYTTKEGKYTGKNHGNAWRIKPSSKSILFGEIEEINITSLS